MKRPMPWSEQVDIISSDESSSSTSSSSSDTDMAINDENGGQQSNENITTDQPVKEVAPEGGNGLAEAESPAAVALDPSLEQADLLFKRAEMYQEYMQQLPIPTHRGSIIPFTSWMGLGKSIKQLYDQPLHYLTNIRLKQWDQLRFGAEDEQRDLDTIIHPCKAEATIWLIEEIHRRTSSHHRIAKLWSSDPMHDAFIDSIFPKSPSE
ncbi:hypothetical protein ACOSP7_007693 [Xanthoceras sorbifolium]|uniref:Protein RDM1 n=1 Tax=Xanthoceras sorbifolium TaxID=99658 RepID=A0ABQ8IBK3_9ROSI|nr:hypothetical protein JRO89_XS03G0211900 [Xanthoceras sorbifolium]